MEGAVGAIIVIGIVVIVIAIAARHHIETKRREALQGFAQTNGWQWAERDDALPGAWDGPPFRGHPRRAKGRNVLSGTHEDRRCLVYEYSYTTTTSTGQTTSTTTHYYTIWVIYLPAALPPISLGVEGALGGRVAKAFGFNRLDIGNPDFDQRFKVKCEHPDFGLRLLHPAMVNELMNSPDWAWRFDGNVMISYRKGRLDPEDVFPRLDAMGAILKHVPREVWDQYGQPAH